MHSPILLSSGNGAVGFDDGRYRGGRAVIRRDAGKQSSVS